MCAWQPYLLSLCLLFIYISNLFPFFFASNKIELWNIHVWAPFVWTVWPEQHQSGFSDWQVIKYVSMIRAIYPFRCPVLHLYTKKIVLFNFQWRAKNPIFEQSEKDCEFSIEFHAFSFTGSSKSRAICTGRMSQFSIAISLRWAQVESFGWLKNANSHP